MTTKKRYIRIDMEYEPDTSLSLWHTNDQIRKLLAEHMPHVKVIFSRDAPDVENLNDKR